MTFFTRDIKYNAEFDNITKTLTVSDFVGRPTIYQSIMKITFIDEDLGNHIQNRFENYQIKKIIFRNCTFATLVNCANFQDTEIQFENCIGTMFVFLPMRF